MDILLKLVEGDISQVGTLDCVLAGRKNATIKKLREKNKVEFMPVDRDDLDCQELCFFSGELHPNWKLFGEVSYRAKPGISMKNVRAIVCALRYALREKKSRNIAIMPFSWRNPKWVAATTLLALWVLAAEVQGSFLRKTYGDPRKVLFCIVADDSIKPYLEVLDNTMAEVWRLLELKLDRSDSYEMAIFKRLRDANVHINHEVLTVEQVQKVTLRVF